MGKYMDNLPTVISCCFCCFLRAGCILIAIASFIVGLTLAPNVSVKHGWMVINSSNTPIETAAQRVLGVVSILLCVVSIMLFVGSFCNFPKLLEFYQWGAIVYSTTTVLVYFALATHCFSLYSDCYTAGSLLLGIMVLNILLTAYFVIVVNSLRLSMIYLASEAAQNNPNNPNASNS